MKVTPTDLPGVLLVELAVHADERGWFVETYHRARYATVGIPDLVQDNVSSSARGVIRGLHYQLASPQGKLVHVLRGAIFDVAVDLRPGSPTFARWFGIRLTADDRRQLWMPPNFAHGFCTLSDAADVAYKCSAPYDPADQHTVRWDDPVLAIAWPRVAPRIISARDAAAPYLRDARLPEPRA